MGVLSPTERERVRRRLAAVSSPVTLLHFTQGRCGLCTDRALALLEELQVECRHLDVHLIDFAAEPAQAERYGVTQVPATVIAGPLDLGLRFDGAPAGAGLDRFLDGIVAVAGGAPRERLAVLASAPTRELVPTG